MMRKRRLYKSRSRTSTTKTKDLSREGVDCCEHAEKHRHRPPRNPVVTPADHCELESPLENRAATLNQTQKAKQMLKRRFQTRILMQSLVGVVDSAAERAARKVVDDLVESVGRQHHNAVATFPRMMNWTRKKLQMKRRN